MCHKAKVTLESDIIDWSGEEIMKSALSEYNIECYMSVSAPNSSWVD